MRTDELEHQRRRPEADGGIRRYGVERVTDLSPVEDVLDACPVCPIDKGLEGVVDFRLGAFQHRLLLEHTDQARAN